MNKSLKLISSMILCLCMTACTQQNTMVIKPATFSEEVTQVLQVLGEDTVFFDFNVDDTVIRYRVDGFIYKDGEWQFNGSMENRIESKENRIALKVDDQSYHLYEVGGTNGCSMIGSEAPYDGFDTTTQTGCYAIQTTIPIVLDEAITLWWKGGAHNGELLSLDSDFRNSACRAGMAYTITFLDE